MQFLPLILVVHITLAIALFLPSILLPLVLRRRPGTRVAGSLRPGAARDPGARDRRDRRRPRGDGRAAPVRARSSLLTQPWLLVALTIYALNLALAFFIQRPNLRRLLRLGAGDDATWRLRARRQRYVSYAMAALVGTIGVLMSTKPTLW